MKLHEANLLDKLPVDACTISLSEFILNISPGTVSSTDDKDESNWRDSIESYSNGHMRFFSEDELEEWIAYCGIPPEDRQFLLDAYHIILADRRLQRLALYLRLSMFEKCRPPRHTLPNLKDRLGNKSGAYYLIVALSMIPFLIKSHEKSGIPEQVTRDTSKEIADYNSNHKMAFSVPGIWLNQFLWLPAYLGGNVFVRIGRLEFMHKIFSAPLRAYRSKKTGNVVALSEPGIEFTKDGHVKCRDIEADADDSWTSALDENDDFVCGNQIFPNGIADKEKTKLHLSEWNCELRKGSNVLDVHIPPGGGLSPDIFISSLRSAEAFMSDKFPKHGFSAFVCESWIFNPDLKQILSPKSNLPAIHGEVFLYPVPSAPEDGLWFVFLHEKFDIKTVRRDTSLRKAVAEFIEKGGCWRSGGMFFLRNDLPKFGTQVYQDMFQLL